MKKIQRYLEKVFGRRIKREYDHILLVVGDEGVGKSTLMLQIMVLWELIRGTCDAPEEIETDELLASIIHSPEGLEEAFAGFESRSSVAVPDAGRVMHKKEAMSSDVVELEKDFLDVRTNEFLVLLGYQWWSDVPTFLQERRAMGVFYIPSRGTVRGYNRDSMDYRVDNDDWPESDLVDTFPDLEGTDLWEQYKALDKKAKAERMDAASDDDEADGWTVREAVEDASDRLDDFVSTNPTNGQRYIDPDLIEFEFELSARKAKQVKKVLARDHGVPDVDEEVAEA